MPVPSHQYESPHSNISKFEFIVMNTVPPCTRFVNSNLELNLPV